MSDIETDEKIVSSAKEIINSISFGEDYECDAESIAVLSLLKILETSYSALKEESQDDLLNALLFAVNEKSIVSEIRDAARKGLENVGIKDVAKFYTRFSEDNRMFLLDMLFKDNRKKDNG